LHLPIAVTVAAVTVVEAGVGMTNAMCAMVINANAIVVHAIVERCFCCF